MTERTTTCCLGDVFFRKRRYSSEAYTPSLKPKVPPLDNDDRIKIPLEGMSRLQVQADVVKAPTIERYQRQQSTTTTATCSTSNARLTSSSDCYNGRRPYALPSTPESGLTSDSYSRAVQRPMASYGSTGVTTMSVGDEPPPKYSPPKVHSPRSATEYVASQDYRQQSLPRSASKPTRVCGLIVDEADKEQEILQTLWMENQQRQPAVSLNDRPAVGSGSNSGLRTIMIEDRMTNTTYRRGRLLGKGGFARCYEMTDMDTNVVYAGKVISKARISKPRQRDKIMREIELHRSLRHPHVVEFHSFFEDEHNIYFILEYCSKKSLVDVLKSRQTLSEPEVRYYMTQLVTGCKYIHSNHVIHRDLKLGNMLLNDNMQVKIADFGLATRIEYRGEKKMTVCGTPNYIAPEVIQRKGHSYEADIWSMGCILYTMLCGRPPFETGSLKETYDRIASIQYVVPGHVSPQATDLIARLLSYNPHDRPTLDAVLRHEFFRCGYLPGTLSSSCCYTAPKFPAFEPPRPQSYAAPVSASHEARVVEQQLRRAASQRMTPRTRRPTPTTAKTEIKVQIEPVKEQFLEEDPLPEGKFTRIDSAGRLCSAVRLYQMLSSCLDAMPPDSFPTPVQNTKVLWITKWVDYSNKYGFGYQLSDGSVGILFNDTTRMSLLKDGKTLRYNDLSNRVVTLNRELVSNDLQKKVTLLIYFGQYMDEHLIYGAGVDGGNRPANNNGSGTLIENAELNVCSGLTTTAVFMKKWFRTDRAIVMHLNNGTLQVNFFDDHTKVIISADAQDYLVTYVDANRLTVAYRLLQLRHFGCSAELAERLDYARQSLKTVINVGSEAV